MSDKYNITDAELEIMNILWDKKKATISEIIDELDKKEKKMVKCLFVFHLIWRKKSS